MRTIFNTAGQAAGLVLIALVIGLSVNAVREKDHIDPWRSYIPKQITANGHHTHTTATQTGENGGGDAVDGQTGNGNDGGETPTTADEPKHPFCELYLDDVVTVYENEKSITMEYIFIDARDDDAYQAGHIPGAIQCDYYRIDHYINNVLGPAMGAERIVVYCNGADCEDSLYLCGELLNTYEVPLERIFLYKGGWEEWHANDLPVETGDAP